jgi:hypothetical protein
MASDPQEPDRLPVAYGRRAIGVLVCFSPLILIIASVAKVAMTGSQTRLLGLGILSLAMLIAAQNFYLCAIRHNLYEWKHGTLKGLKNISPVPGLGTILIVVGTIAGFGSSACAALGLVAFVLDMGGLPWFLIATWWDGSMWDE